MALINLSLNKQTYIPNYRLRICILTTLIFLSYLIYSFHWVFILPFLMINFYIFYIVSGITSLKLNFETNHLRFEKIKINLNSGISLSKITSKLKNNPTKLLDQLQNSVTIGK